MDISQLPRSLQVLVHSGITLSTEMCSILKASLTILQKENRFKRTYFWGQILGIDADYYIAYGYENDILQERIFYYSLNGEDWLRLQKPKKPNFYLTSISSTRFQGDPSLRLPIFDDAPTSFFSQNAERGAGDQQKQVNSNNIEPVDMSLPTTECYELKEEDRLACTVQQINQEACVIPRGALIKRINCRVVPNEAFKGLDWDEATRLQSYFHFRVPLQKWDKNLTYRRDGDYSLDFMDPICIDVPSEGECWSLRINAANIIILQNAYWPGLTFYHKIKTSDFGCIYIGSGIKNLDVPFMLQ
ncbi:hypothetical protein AAG570_006385 [Ranatra chinensis]|uniref:Radial spoke head protein 9 homolog n=1 Tax=Ranatra chinensis TaxID=642074 RepID=A0ABD0YUG9_9HEMI